MLKKLVPTKPKLWQTLKEIGIIVSSDYNVDINNKKRAFVVKWIRNFYAVFIAFIIIFSFITFALINNKTETPTFFLRLAASIEVITFIVLLIDFILRAVTYPTRDKKYKGKYAKSFFKFFLTSIFLITFVSLLPSLIVINIWLGQGKEIKFFEILGSLKLIRFLRLFLILNIFYAFKNISSSLREQKSILIYSFIFIVAIIFLFGLTIYYTENTYILKNYQDLGYQSTEAFYAENKNVAQTYWQAVYFTAITLTTIGYGDFVPLAPITKMIVPIISILGIAIITLPGGIIAASFMGVISKKKTTQNEIKEQSEEIAKMIENAIEKGVKEKLEEMKKAEK
ncbi:potassium channel family protein [Mycoplasmopsis columbina]|uniref:potassium channel family protein n=1 Tax=Mycoplasmopsis columbina TaxID=114881 RepID=UPI0004A72524|nr:ion transporter [Mycoplasmopsis columbina]VEU76702.1 Ion channel [Mycoplasmopsis columbina]